MATEDIVGGLFGINPDMYRQQQQQQVFNRAVALQNLDPFQQAAVGYQQAGYNLAGALGGAMGGVDPQLQRISVLNTISKQIDQSNPESMLQGAKMLADAGFTQEALGLAQYARKANSEIAIAQKNMAERRAASTTKEIQNTEYAANIRVLLDELKSRPQNPDTEKQIALLEARLAGLPQPKEAAVSTNIQDSLEIGRLVGKIAELDKLPPDLQDPTRKKQLEAQLGSLTKNTKQGEFAQILQDAGFIPGSEEYKNKMTDFVNLKLAEKPETKTEAMKNAISFADLSSFKKGTPEYNQLVKEKFDEFTGKAEKAPPAVGVDREAIAKELYFKPFSELSQAEIKAVNAEADKRDLANKKATAVQIQIPLGDAMTKALGMGEKKEQAAAWGTAGEAYKAAIPMIDKLNQVKNSLSSTFTGAGADAKLAFSKGLAAFGIPVNVNEIGKAEYFNAVSSQLVQAIARVFPGSQSNKELDQLLKSKPNAYQEIPTILRLIGQIQDEMIASTKAYEKLDALGVDGRSKANPAIIEGQVYTKLKRYRELEARATGGKPMQQKDIDEAKKLQQELGVQ